MKRLLVLTLTLLAAALLTAAQAETTTLLAYMCGADIQFDACIDIYEMGMAEVGDDVNIVILAGGADEWEFDEIEGGTRSLITLKDGDFETITDWGWKSMGSEESLREFLEYGLTEYPADRVVVVLWNHGAGSEAGMCFDGTTEDEDGLSLVEINNALYDVDETLGGFHIDVFGCDACMMATYEMAAMLSYYNIDYFVASEELVPYSGWEYTGWLEALHRDPGMSNEALCQRIVDGYMAAAIEENPDDFLTLSAVDLGRITPLQETLEDFAGTLLGELEGGNVADVRRGRSSLYTFGSFIDGSWDMVDMGAMLDAYAAFDPESAVRARKELSEAVVVNRQTENLDPCSGLSVLIPQDTKSEFEAYSDGLDLSFYMPNWIGFVKAYAGALQAGGYTFSGAAPEQLSDTDDLSQILALVTGSCPSGYCWDEDSEVYTPAGPIGPTVEVGEGEYAFTARLTAEDMQYLDYVEGMLAMDLSDDEVSAWLDLGLMRNNLVNWDTGDVYSLFDGTWPILGDQLVAMYDQISNERGRRSLIPVVLNGEHTYLVVEFPAGGGEGRVLGANAGFDDNGLPIRQTTRLEDGDVIVPLFNMYVDIGSEELEEMEFEGDAITWEDGMTVAYEDISDDGDPLEMMFCFVLNDVFGDYTLTDLIAFEV